MLRYGTLPESVRTHNGVEICESLSMSGSPFAFGGQIPLSLAYVLGMIVTNFPKSGQNPPAKRKRGLKKVSVPYVKHDESMRFLDGVTMKMMGLAVKGCFAE